MTRQQQWPRDGATQGVNIAGLWVKKEGAQTIAGDCSVHAAVKSEEEIASMKQATQEALKQVNDEVAQLKWSILEEKTT